MSTSSDDLLRDAMAHYAAGRNAAAAAMLRAAPEDPAALHLLGLLRAGDGALDEAIALLRRALAAAPANPDALAHLGALLGAAGQTAAARDAYAAALGIDPGHATALSNRGALLRDLGEHEAALADLDAAVARAPDFAEAWANRALVLHALGRLADARDSADRALAHAPGLPEMLTLRGMIDVERDSPEAAVASLSQALAMAPDQPRALNALGLALVRLERWAEAAAAFRGAIAGDPGLAEARVNLGLLHLLQGDFSKGWPLYAARLELLPPLRSAAPVWDGETPLAGRTILIAAEQGMGDILQFCRYAPELAAAGARVILEADAPLLTLLESLGGVTLLPRGGALPPHDVVCPLLSLPQAFSAIPAPDGYLAAAPARVARWAGWLGPRLRPRVGLAWSGNPHYSGDAQRSLTLAALRAALPDGIEYVCLQKDLRAGDMGAVFPGLRRPEIADFADTAALAALCDVVVSTCTSVAHLSGALGRPTWVLLQRVPGWRWLLDRTDSPWYASARLYRQPRRGDWDSVFVALRRDLAALSAAP